MKQILILVEGQTEELFVKELLRSYLLSFNVTVTPALITNKGNRGGLPGYGRVKNEIKRLLKIPYLDRLTTMFDYYALPQSFPGADNPPYGNAFQRVAHRTEAFEHDIADARFLPYLSLHEFEALLFTDPQVIDATFETSRLKGLQQIANQYPSPEAINADQPPSKRLYTLNPKYQKVRDGFSIAQEIGIERIRQACSHFNGWLIQLENTGKSNA